MRLSSILTIYDVLKAERDRLGSACKLAQENLNNAAKAAPADQSNMDYDPYVTAKAILHKVYDDYHAVDDAITDIETHGWT